MNTTTMLYTLAALIIGFILGMVAELLAEAEQIGYLNQKLDHYRQRNADLEQQLANERALHDVTYYEITDKSVDPENIPDFTGNF